MSIQTYDLLATSLQELRGRMGDTLFADRKRLSSLLFDRAPEAKREIRALATAIEEGVPAALEGAERHHLGMEMDRQAARLESSTGIRLDIALPVVRVIAFALDLGPLPSVYQLAAPAPGPAPAPQAAQPAQPAQPAPVYQPQPQPQPVYPPHPPSPARAGGFLDKLPFDKKYLAYGAAALVAMVVGLQMLTPKVPAGPDQPTDPRTVDQTGPAAQTNYAGELTDHGVAAKRELESNVGSPTPLNIPVGQRITTGEVQRLIAGDPSALLIDVLADPHPNTIRNALFLPAAGQGGTVSDNIQGRVVSDLRQAVGNQANRPLIFFCAGAICWESYNAVLRAHAAGYRNIYWYRGGLRSWSEAGLPMQPLQGQQQPSSANFFQ